MTHVEQVEDHICDCAVARLFEPHSSRFVLASKSVRNNNGLGSGFAVVASVVMAGEVLACWRARSVGFRYACKWVYPGTVAGSPVPWSHVVSEQIRWNPGH